MSIEDDNSASLERRDSAILDVLMETLPDLIYFKDLEGRYIRISRSHARILGLDDPADAIGRTVAEFVSPEHARESMHEEQEVIRTGLPIEGKEEKVTMKDGRELWFSTTKRPWCDAAGGIIGTVGVIRNIDAEKRAQERLAAEQTLLRTIIDHLPSRIFVKDADARFIVNNRVHLKSLGVERPEDAIGKRTVDFFPSDRGQQALRDDWQVLGGGAPIFDQEKSDFGEEGSARWSLTTKVPLKDKDGGIIGLVGISHDITQRRRYEQELRKRNLEMETDLRMACQLQQAFMPQSYPVVPPNVPPEQSRLKFEHLYLPSATLGGDFFDVTRVSDHEVGVLICDVMGHGVRSGLITALIRGLVVELSAVAGDPAQMLREINDDIVPVLSQTGLPVFASLFYAVIDANAGTIRYTNAGHPSPYVLRRANGTVEPLRSSDPEPAAGLEAGFAYTENRVAFGPGDGLFMCSDGLFEAANPAGEQLGEPALQAVVQANIALRGGALIDTVFARVTGHAGGAKFDDDICVLIVERSG
jgi:phosphoserine phosphatase RsbU/P